MSEVATLIQKLAGTHRIANCYLTDAIVKSVNVSTRMCVVETLGGKVSSSLTVRLMASVDDGCFIIPAVDSTIVILFSEQVAPIALMYSEVERITWLGGEYDGVPIVKHPTNTNKGLLKKIQNLENLLNDLITKFNSHTHILTIAAQAGSGGTGTAAPTTTQETGTISPTTVQADIEHPNIKH